MVRIHGARRVRRKTNWLPLLNIILILLFYFITAGSVFKRNQAILLPVTSNGETSEVPAEALYVDKEGKFFHHGEPVKVDEFLAHGGAAPSRDRLLLAVDRRLPADDLFSTTRLLRARGYTTIELVTISPGGQ